MKLVLAGLLMLAAMPCALAQAAGQQPPAPTAVKVRGEVAVMRVELTSEGKDGKVVQKAITVLTVDLQDKVQIQLQLPRLLPADEVIPLVNKGIIAEGQLKTVDKQMTLVCKTWTAAEGEKDKALPAGTVSIVGKAARGKHAYGRGKESPLALENGARIIIVAGPLTKKQAELQGILRVAGKLRLDEAGAVLVEAVKVEKAAAK